MNTHRGKDKKRLLARILRGGVLALCLLLFLSSCGDSGPLTHTVTFDPNGGKLRGDAVLSVIDGDTIDEPEIPYRSGYRFTYWYLDKEKRERFNFSTPIIESITLYAGWSYINPDVPAEVEEPEIGTWTPVEGNPEDVEL